LFLMKLELHYQQMCTVPITDLICCRAATD
jgi:hypothetical protein